MKTSMISIRAFVLAMFAIFSTSLISPAMANGGDTVELRFIGKIQDQPLFQMNFLSAEESEFIIVVRDEYNNVLYRDNFKGGNGSRKFMLTEEAAHSQIRFEISGKTLGKPVVFEINNHTKTVQDIVVNRL